ncbi:MAG: hypothetical protein ABIH46_07450 [Chloroflexota bacterium]
MLPDVPPEITAEGLARYTAQGFHALTGRETPAYARDWGMWEAIRDLVQNALDETEDFTLERTGTDVTFISDRGQGFGVMAFMLGQEKQKPDYMRGRFGEGMKLACIAILREGYRLSFETYGQGRPLEGAGTFLEQVVLGERVKSLAFLVRDATTPINGTTFRITGYTGPLYAERFAQNQVAVEIIPVLQMVRPLQRYDCIFPGDTGIRAKSPPGYVYARDIYMKTEPTRLSYNMWGFNMARDRHAPEDSWQYERALGDLWCGVTDVPLIRYFLTAVTSDDATFEKEARFTIWEAGTARLQRNADFWKRAWAATFGRAAVMIRPELVPRLNHWGYEAINLPYNMRAAIGSVVGTDESVLAELGESLRVGTEPVPDRALTGDETRHLSVLRYISDHLAIALEKRPTIQAAEFTTETVQGDYDPSTLTINIKRSFLLQFGEALDIFIHEYAHYWTNADDGTERHTRAISTVGRYVGELLTSGEMKPGPLVWVKRPW